MDQTYRRLAESIGGRPAPALKFFLHTPVDKQRKKLRKAEKKPDQGWRVDKRDWIALDQMGPRMPVVERILCGRPAPRVRRG